MRDPKRIDKVLAKVKEVWQTYPDLRLGQLLMIVTVKDKDLFYVEDEKLVEYIDNFYKRGDGQ